jgi:hypothetical protein
MFHSWAVHSVDTCPTDLPEASSAIVLTLALPTDLPEASRKRSALYCCPLHTNGEDETNVAAPTAERAH